MGDLLRELKAHHTVTILKSPFTPKRVEQFMRNLDVLYIEWCIDYMVTITNVPKHCKIVTRLHRMEVHGRWGKKAKFQKVDLLILVNSFMKDYCFQYMPNLRNVKKIKVIQHGVDIDEFKYNPGRGYGKRLGWVGYLKPVKDPLFALTLMNSLPRWQLRFIGLPSKHPHLTRATRKLAREHHNIVWLDKKISHNKMPAYYRKLDIFLNTSTIESQCVSILEAMSCGVYPLIRKWPHPQCRPEEIYPEANLFTTVEECKRKIGTWVKLSVSEKRQKSRQMRQFIEARYNAKDKAREMRQAIESA